MIALLMTSLAAQENIKPINSYLDQTPPGDEPQVFAKGSVSVDGKNTHALQFAPDGSFLVFSRYPDGTSFRMVRSQTGWSQPEPTSFKGKEVSFDPLLKRLFYYDQGDIYFVGYSPEGFSKPTRLPSSINTTKEMEYYPCITAHRNLYFSRDGKWQTARVQVTKLQGDGFGDPVDLGAPINIGGASHAFVAPDESYMLFNSPRAGSYTKNDIWVSFRNLDGSWAKPVNLGEWINRDATAVLCPTVSPDGKYLFFTRLQEESNTGYVYWVSTRIIENLRAKESASVQQGKSANLTAPTATGVFFTETGQQLNRLAGRGIALADLDGDGCLDAFVVNVNTPDGEGHRVYFGNCHVQFTDSGQRLTNPSNWEGTPAVVDVNGDGKPDVITGNTVWINDGKGYFEAHPELIEPSDAKEWGSVKLADLNSDGYLDLVAVSEWRSLRIYLNDGKGHFHDTGQKLGSGIIGSLAVGDVNGDGAIDVVTAGWKIEGSDYTPSRVWLNDGKSNFKDGGPIDYGENHAHGVALGDVNGDGWLDIVMACTTPGQAGKVYLNDGKGHFHDSGQILGHRWVHSVALGDLDGDGSLDVFFACGEPETGTPNEVWLNDGKGNFRDSGLRLGNAFSWDVALGDLNGDGRLDAFVANLRLVDGSKNPPIFGGVPAEIWLNTTPNGTADKPVDK